MEKHKHACISQRTDRRARPLKHTRATYHASARSIEFVSNCEMGYYSLRFLAYPAAHKYFIFFNKIVLVVTNTIFKLLKEMFEQITNNLL